MLRKDDPNNRHWVALTKERYTDDAYYWKVKGEKGYNIAQANLELLEQPESLFGGLNSSVLPQHGAFDEYARVARKPRRRRSA